MRNHPILVAGLAAMLAVACGSKNEAEVEPTMSELLYGSNWLAEDIAGRGVMDKLQSTLKFQADDRVAGLGGCNRFFGSLSIVADNITIGALGGTRMACEPAIMEQEQRFLETLEQAKVVRLDEKQKQLYMDDAGGREILRFKRLKK